MTRGRLRTASDLSLAVQSGLGWYERGRDWYRQKSRYTVTIRDKDPLYSIVLQWLVAEAGPEARRNVIGSMDWEDRRRVFQLLFDEDTNLKLRVDGHPVEVTSSRQTAPHSATGGGGETVGVGVGWESLLRGTDLRFVCRTSAAQAAVQDKLAALVEAKNRTPGQIEVHTLNPWGSWTEGRIVQERPLASIVLPKGVRDEVSADLARFLVSEEDYVRRGIPWHRCYLMHGPPGTGKSSLARALATEHRLDLWTLPMTDLAGDAKLYAMILDVRPNSILLIEDIDSVKATRRTEDGDDRGEVSLSGILNALDGVATPHGLITILTSNDLSRVDPAVLRPGRVDVQVEFELADSRLAAELATYFYDQPVDVYLRGRHSPSQVMEILKRNMDDPDKARLELALL